jgi:hypothetical protein
MPSGIDPRSPHEGHGPSLLPVRKASAAKPNGETANQTLPHSELSQITGSWSDIAVSKFEVSLSVDEQSTFDETHFPAERSR